MPLVVPRARLAAERIRDSLNSILARRVHSCVCQVLPRGARRLGDQLRGVGDPCPTQSDSPTALRV